MAARTDRRHFINSALAGTAGAGAFLSLEEKILGAALDGGPTVPGTPGYKKASAPTTPAAPAYKGEPLIRGQIRGLKVSRLILGGNLIGGWAHSRDLMYVSQPPPRVQHRVQGVRDPEPGRAVGRDDGPGQPGVLRRGREVSQGARRQDPDDGLHPSRPR